MSARIARRFAALRAANRAAFVPFVMAGDPDPAAAHELLLRLPEAGADLVELGMPFTDPMADGPAIQAAGLRALKAGQTLAKTLDLAAAFRARHAETPLVLMGYLNPIHHYGPARFVADATKAGVDGLIIVDLPPEEDAGLGPLARQAGLSVIRLATPTTDAARLPAVLRDTAGFLYYVSITGITGTAEAAEDEVTMALARLRRETDLPLAVGFGIKTPEAAARVARAADAVVVGSALVSRLAEGLDADGRPRPDGIAGVIDLAARLAAAIHAARTGGAR